MKHFRTYYRPLPGGVKAAVRPCKDEYIILINSTLPEDQQRRELKHELAHIYLDHYAQHSKPIAAIEEEANAMADTMTDEVLLDLMQWQVCV